MGQVALALPRADATYPAKGAAYTNLDHQLHAGPGATAADNQGIGG
jgi:hypothetical protein